MSELQVIGLPIDDLPSALAVTCEDSTSFPMLVQQGMGAKYGVPMRIGTFEPLIPVSDCLQMMTVVEQFLTPAGDTFETKQSVTAMLRLYPSGSRLLKDTDYVNGLISMFARFPLSVHAIAVDEITARSASWPTRALVKQVCEEALAEIMALKQVLWTHQNEHKRRQSQNFHRADYE